jgi:hypothetical protein
MLDNLVELCNRVISLQKKLREIKAELINLNQDENRQKFHTDLSCFQVLNTVFEIELVSSIRDLIEEINKLPNPLKTLLSDPLRDFDQSLSMMNIVAHLGSLIVHRKENEINGPGTPKSSSKGKATPFVSTSITQKSYH